MTSKSRTVGWTITAFVTAFLLFDAGLHIARPQSVVKSFDELGVPEHLAVPSGVIMLVFLALYLLPATARFGAVVLSGYLGGAVAVHMIAESPLLSSTLFPVYIGFVVWGGLWLRDPVARVIIPQWPSRAAFGPLHQHGSPEMVRP